MCPDSNWLIRMIHFKRNISNYSYYVYSCILLIIHIELFAHSQLHLIYVSPLCAVIPPTGQRGLEIRCHGAGPTLPLDIHNSCRGGHGRDYPAGAHALRYSRTHWHQAVGDCLHDGQAECGEARVVSPIRTKSAHSRIHTTHKHTHTHSSTRRRTVWWSSTRKSHLFSTRFFKYFLWYCDNATATTTTATWTTTKSK